MLLRFLQTPLIDIILVLLAVRFIWPGLFSVFTKKPQVRVKEKKFVDENSSYNKTKYSADQGKYIDYEEIK